MSSSLLLAPFAFLYWVALLATVVAIAYYGSRAIYNIWFHPLAKFPGPRFAAVSSLWYGWQLYKGDAPAETLKLHERHGNVVRVAPNELSFVNPITWKEIYGHKKAGEPELAKDPKYHAGISSEPTLLNADREQHKTIRRSLAHGFSESSLRSQEPIIQGYLERFVNRIIEKGQNGNVPIDMRDWYEFFTFDTIGYLTYGESFNCIDNAKPHLWIELFVLSLRLYAWSQVAGRLPSFLRKPFLAWVTPPNVREGIKTETEIVAAKVNHRLGITPTFPDFMGRLFDSYKSPNNTMTHYQLLHNSRILIIGGSETTSSALSGLTYLLMTNPDVHEKLKAEIRSTFKSVDEITSNSTNSCKYLLATIQEALRVYPPTPGAHQRYTPPGGMMVGGHFIPGGVAVGITTYAMTNTSLNFEHPRKFVPERWLGEASIYPNDKKDAFQPFSVGPRNCIGGNLALLEVKLIISRLMWQFDLELCATSRDWLDQKIYMVWSKTPLPVKLHPRKFS